MRLTAQAAAVEPVVDPKTLKNVSITVEYVFVNDCDSFAKA